MTSIQDLLKAKPRVSLAHLPTPLEPLKNLSAHLNGPEIWIKRDDCTGLASGGNKTRKLEFLMGQALADGVETVITVGGLQSNHARQTAAAAAKLGLHCQLVLPKVVPITSSEYETNGNMLLDNLFGAEVFIEADEQAASKQVIQLFGLAKDKSKKFAFFPAGGSTAIGALAYVNAADELHQQMLTAQQHFDAIYLASSTGGTLAGLMTGADLIHQWQPHFYGSCVATDKPESMLSEIVKLRADVAATLAIENGGESNVSLSSDQLGPAYGITTDETVAAIRLCAETEGLLLDPVYSGKAMAALISDIRTKRINAASVLFWHTGGSAGLFAYQSDFG